MCDVRARQQMSRVLTVQKPFEIRKKYIKHTALRSSLKLLIEKSFSLIKLYFAIYDGDVLMHPFRNVVKFLSWKAVSTSPNPQERGSPLVGRLRLHIQYIRS